MPRSGGAAQGIRLKAPYVCKSMQSSMRRSRGTSTLFTQLSTLSITMQALREGPRQRRRMDAAQPRNIDSIISDSTVWKFRLCEADPSPGLRLAPFSKGARAYGFSHKSKRIRSGSNLQHAGPWRRAAAKPQDGCREAAGQLKAQG